MYAIYLKDKIMFCKAISVLLEKSRSYLKINRSQYTPDLSLPETYLQSVKTVKETSEG